jgi:hypothetical protein
MLRADCSQSSFSTIQFGILTSSFQPKSVKFKIYRNIILPAVLCGCETWSLTLKEERRLRAFENTVLRETFEAEREELILEWRRLRNEELHNLYPLPNFIEE